MSQIIYPDGDCVAIVTLVDKYSKIGTIYKVAFVICLKPISPVSEFLLDFSSRK